MSWSENDNLAERSPGSDPRLPRRLRDYRYWPTQVLDQLIVLFLVLSGLVGFAVLFPIRALGPADPLTRPEVVKPQWYFLPLHQLTHYLPAWLVALLLVGGGLVLLVWPLVDAEITRHLGPEYGPRAGRLLGLLAVGGLLFLGVLGLYSDRTCVFLGHYFRVDSYGLPHSMPAVDTAAAEPSKPPPETPPAATNPAAAPGADQYAPQRVPPSAVPSAPPVVIPGSSLTSPGASYAPGPPNPAMLPQSSGTVTPPPTAAAPPSQP